MNHPRTLALGLALAAITLAASGCTEPASADAPVATAAPSPQAAAPAPAEPTPEPARTEPTPAPAEAPEPPARPRPSLRADALRIQRMVVARDVVDREPVDAADTFAASDERLFAFFEFRNRGGEEQELTVTFEGPDGRSTGHVMLSVPANVWRWRTWAWTRGADEPGDWTAELRTADGELLESHDFTVE